MEGWAVKTVGEIEPGDLLIFINTSPIKSKSEIHEYQNLKNYQIIRKANHITKNSANQNHVV